MPYRDNTSPQIDTEALAEELMHDLNQLDVQKQEAPLDHNIQQLRDKIKSARLEKLMASQLESELVIDAQPISSDTADSMFESWTDFEEVSELPKPANTEGLRPIKRLDEVEIEEAKSDIAEVLAAPSSSKNINVKQSMQTCESLCENIAEGFEIFSKLNERAETLKDHLSVFESDMVALEQTRMALEQLDHKHQSLLSTHRESATTLERQSKRIAHLEARLNSTTNTLETTRTELKKSKDTINRRDEDIRAFKLKLAAGEDGTRHLKTKIERLEISLEESNAKVEAGRGELASQSGVIDSLQGQIEVLANDKKRLKEKLDDVQSKYDEFNRRGLEQQSQHYSKMHELEKTIRELRRDVDLARQDKAQAILELKAANNLLTLHEEMLEALSSEKD